MEYKIVVQATVNREYLVKADSPEDAITKYRQGEGTLTYQANDEIDPWPEDWDTAGVMMHCELCGDERLEEDLNEDQRCPPCAEREERNEEYDPDDGRCHDCGRVRPDWRSQTNCSICGVGLDWYCVDAHQCNTPQSAPREDLAEEE